MGEYERDLPTNDSPAVVNALYTGERFKSIGDINNDAYIATIMDLINRRYLSYKKDDNGKILINKDCSKLEDYEIEAIDMLKLYSDESNDVISLDIMHDSLNEKEGALKFNENFNSWKFNLENHVKENLFDGIFTQNGRNYFLAYGVIAFIVGLILSLKFIISSSNAMSVEYDLFYASAILCIAGIE